MESFIKGIKNKIKDKAMSMSIASYMSSQEQIHGNLPPDPLRQLPGNTCGIATDPNSITEEKGIVLCGKEKPESDNADHFLVPGDYIIIHYMYQIPVQNRPQEPDTRGHTIEGWIGQIVTEGDRPGIWTQKDVVNTNDETKDNPLYMGRAENHKWIDLIQIQAAWNQADGRYDTDKPFIPGQDGLRYRAPSARGVVQDYTTLVKPDPPNDGRTLLRYIPHVTFTVVQEQMARIAPYDRYTGGNQYYYPQQVPQQQQRANSVPMIALPQQYQPMVAPMHNTNDTALYAVLFVAFFLICMVCSVISCAVGGLCGYQVAAKQADENKNNKIRVYHDEDISHV